MPSFNDLDLKKWKDSEILTDSLWIISKRNNTGKHSGFYHGNFIPQIPHQFILRYTKKDDVVFDPFLGSGTTVIAAEKNNRICYGMELDEKYCDVIVKRWQNFTGKQAVLESTGETF